MKFYPQLKIIFALCLLFFCGKLFLYHYNVIVYPYPQQYREGAMMTSTEALIHGKNPFDMKMQPQYTNDYGIGYPLVVAPFAKVFGPTMLVHRWVSAFFIFACCALLFIVMRRLSVPLLLNLSGVLLFYASLLYPGTTTPTADASSLGLFLFFMTIFWPWLKGYSWGSLLLSVVLGIACYYTKPYFLISVPLIGSYVFFFVSKRKGLAYTAAFFTLFILSIAIVHRMADAYFANCFFIHDNIRHLYDDHLKNQVIGYIQLHAGILISLFVALGYLVAKRSFKFAVPLHVYCGAGTMLLLLIWLGKHNGANWYFFHLFSPFLLIGTFSLLGRFPHWPIAALLLIVFNFWSITQGHNYKNMNFNHEQWGVVKQLITNNRNVLTTSLLTPLLVEQGKEFDDSGMSEYFKMGSYRYNKRTEAFFPPNAQVILQFYKYADKLVNRVTNKHFDMVIITRDYAPQVPEEVTRYYEYVGDLELPLAHAGGSYIVTVMKPKANE